MGLAKVVSFPTGLEAAAAQHSSILTARRKLLVAWVFIGLFPFCLQIRSYWKFATPHKITENLLVPLEAVAITDELLEKCPMQGFHIGQVWWNVATTHYYTREHGYNLCHYVVPQYNSHGNYLIGKTRVKPYDAAPNSCINDSFPIELYFYHGSIGYYSFYDELVGTYCITDSTAYTHAAGLGTFDINGESLAKDPGNDRYRWSLYYSIVGSFWLVFRGLVLRRSYISCKRYGQKCEQAGVSLHRKAATIFVHESLRLSAHGATNYHRLLLLYMLLEGLMSDLFLLATTDGSFVWIQYVSLGYNLSGILLLLFEIVESMGWLRETCRLCIKRLVFSYESSLLGELLGALGQSYFLTSLNHSGLKHSRPVALNVSYYVWSLVGHGAIVAVLIGIITFVRILRAVTFVHWKHGRTWAFFTMPCCVDTTLGLRSKMTKLAGYQWNGEELFYRSSAMKSFGLLKMDEDGAEFLVLQKLHWFKVRQDDLVAIGSVSNQRVTPCTERPCSGVISFFDQDLGGPGGESESPRSQPTRVINKVAPSPTPLNILPPQTEK